MEAVERLTVQFPELESLSSVLADFTGKLVTDEREGLAYMTDAQQNVTAEMADFFSLVDTLEPEVGKLQDDLISAPLDSITGLHSYVQAEVLNGPEHAQVAGADRLCENLLSMLSTCSTGSKTLATAPESTNSNLKNWAHEFVYEPMAEISAYSQKQSQEWDGLLSRELNLTAQVEKMSEQISTPGFNQHRVELKGRRLELAHELFGVLKEKQLALAGLENKTGNFLDRKSSDFKEVCTARLQEHRTSITQHKSAAEQICMHMDSVAQYAMQKELGIAEEENSAEERQLHRTAKVRRVSKVLREAFAGIIEIVRECQEDRALVGRLELEKELAAKGSEDLQGRFGILKDLHTKSAEMADEVLTVDLKFNDWLQDLYNAMKTKCREGALKLGLGLSENRARMRALSQTVIDQIRTERESLQGALKATEKEVNDCQEGMSRLEYQQPSEVDIAHHMDRFQRVQEVAKWQLNKIGALTHLEEDLMQNSSEPQIGDSDCSDERPCEEEAEGWVRKIFLSNGIVRQAPQLPETDSLIVSPSLLGKEAAEVEGPRVSPCKKLSLSERLAESLERNSQYLAHTQASLNSRSSTPRSARYSAHSRSSTPRYSRHLSSASSLQAERGSTATTSLQAESRGSTVTTPSMPGGDTQLGSVYVAPGNHVSSLKSLPTTRIRPLSPGSRIIRAAAPGTGDERPTARLRPASPSGRVISAVAQGASDDKFPVKAQLRSASLGRSFQKAQGGQGYPVMQMSAHGVHHPVPMLLQANNAEHSGASTPSTATPSNSNASALSAAETPSLAQTATVLKSLPLTLAPRRQPQASSGECTFTRPGRAGVVPVRAMARSASMGCLPGRRHELGQ